MYLVSVSYGRSLSLKDMTCLNGGFRSLIIHDRRHLSASSGVFAERLLVEVFLRSETVGFAEVRRMLEGMLVSGGKAEPAM